MAGNRHRSLQMNEGRESSAPRDASLCRVEWRLGRLLPLADIALLLSANGDTYINVTGMIEIAPIKPRMKVVRSLVWQLNPGVCLAADVITPRTRFQESRQACALGA